MSKFNVGDRVTNKVLGGPGTVTRVADGVIYVKFDDGRKNVFGEDDFSCSEQYTNLLPLAKFNVGAALNQGEI